MLRKAWTHEELDAMLRTTEARLEKVEAETPNVRGLPPLAEEECFRYICSMLDLASERVLTLDECFLMGQLIAQYRMAVEARMLGRRGRYYVISEADLERASER
jgi:hypothetical protein